MSKKDQKTCSDTECGARSNNDCIITPVHCTYSFSFPPKLSHLKASSASSLQAAAYPGQAIKLNKNTLCFTVYNHKVFRYFLPITHCILFPFLSFRRRIPKFMLSGFLTAAAARSRRRLPPRSPESSSHCWPAHLCD